MKTINQYLTEMRLGGAGPETLQRRLDEIIEMVRKFRGDLKLSNPDEDREVYEFLNGLENTAHGYRDNFLGTGGRHAIPGPNPRRGV